MSILHDGTLANPFAIRTGPTAIVSPVYPALYASAVWLFGSGLATLWLLWFANFLLLSTSLGLLPLASFRMGLGLAPGTIAALLGAIFLHIHIDTNWGVFLATFLCVLVFVQLVRAPAITRQAVVLGLSLGLLIFTQPAFSLLLFPWPLIWLYGHPQMARRFVLVIALAALVVTPWIIRNYRQFGEFIFVRDGFGLELYISNNFDAAPSFNENMRNGSHMKLHPNLNTNIARDLQREGEYNYFQGRKKLALAWISANPFQFLLLTFKRITLFWFPAPDPLTLITGIRSYGPWLVTLLSFPGLWFLYQGNKRAALLLGTALLLYPAVYYVVQFDVRYRYPIYWVSLMLAGIAIAHIAAKFRTLTPTSDRELQRAILSKQT